MESAEIFHFEGNLVLRTLSSVQNLVYFKSEYQRSFIVNFTFNVHVPYIVFNVLNSSAVLLKLNSIWAPF